LEMALLRVGFGAVLFAPNRRFMMGAYVYKKACPVLCEVVFISVV